MTLETFRTAWDADARDAARQPSLPSDELARLCRDADREAVPAVPRRRRSLVVFRRRRVTLSLPLRYAASIAAMLAVGFITAASIPQWDIQAIDYHSVSCRAEVTSSITQILLHA